MALLFTLGDPRRDRGGAIVGAAFFLFGLLVVNEELARDWVGSAPNVLLEISIAGREVVVTEALVRVATVLAGFASLYFAAVALGGARNREALLDDVLERFRRVHGGAVVLPRRPGGPARPGSGRVTRPWATYHSAVRRRDSSMGV